VVKQDGRVRRAERLREERRSQVLGAARRVFSEQGYHATSIAHILDEAKIARGTFYLYFQSKRAVFDALLDEFFALMTREVRRIDVRPGALPPFEQLASIVRNILSTLLANAELTRILLRETHGLDAEFDRKLADFYGRIRALLEHALESGVALGLVRPGDVRLRAHMCLGSVKEVVDGLLARRSAPGEGRAATEAAGGLVDLDLAAREILDFSLHGLFQHK